MDWLQFISSMTGALAWPIVALIVVLCLRKRIVENLEEFELPGGYKARFRKSLDTGRKRAEELIGERSDITKRPHDIADEEMFLRGSIPDAAILFAYKEVEELLLNIRGQLGVHVTFNLPSVMRKLLEMRLIDETTFKLFESLRKARNAAVHAGFATITPAEALEFHDQAELLKDILRRVSNKLKETTAPKQGQ
jgi:hypothetical protein